jgi:enoyl-CoA hydratase
MDFENLLVTRDRAVATITINRPKALNALNSHTVNELLEASHDLEIDPDVRAIILTGAGEKAFVAGADIAEMAEMRPREARHFAELGHGLADAIEGSDKVWIAAVNGFALGGGCELALACDFIYALRGAKFGQPEVTLGVIPGFGGTQRLLRRVGIAKAKELIFTGGTIDADEALRIRLVDLVVDRAPPSEGEPTGDAARMLLHRALETAVKVARVAPLAVAEAKRVIHAGQSLPLHDACSLEAHTFASLFDTADQKEGMAAFREKRKPKFEGK